MMKRLCVLAIAGAIVGLAAGTPASAGTGCNGVVNPFVWGCAPWDNNNGSQYPYFKKKTIQVPAAQSKIENKNGQNMVLYNGNYYPMVAAGGGNLVASGAGNLVASGAGNLTVIAPN